MILFFTPSKDFLAAVSRKLYCNIYTYEVFWILAAKILLLFIGALPTSVNFYVIPLRHACSSWVLYENLFYLFIEEWASAAVTDAVKLKNVFKMVKVSIESYQHENKIKKCY